MDEQLFGEVSELLCTAAAHLPRRFSKAKRIAAAAAAAVRARMGAELSLSMGDDPTHPPHSHHTVTRAPSKSGQAMQGAGQKPGSQALHAGTVSRAMWAFAMQGLHDDPLLPTLMPHVRVGLKAVCV